VWFSSAPDKRFDVIETAPRCATVIRLFDSGRVVYQVREGNQTGQPRVAKRTDRDRAVRVGLFLQYSFAGHDHDTLRSVLETVCMLHFAYGSNMCAALMRRRCPGARLEGRACLPGYRFVILRSGYASVVPAPGSSVHGLLWRLTPRDVAALNVYENLAGGLYRAVTMAVVSHRRRRAALVYMGSDSTLGRPRPGYLDIVTQAARDAGFPSRYLACLTRWASASNTRRTPPPHPSPACGEG